LGVAETVGSRAFSHPEVVTTALVGLAAQSLLTFGIAAHHLGRSDVVVLDDLASKHR